MNKALHVGVELRSDRVAYKHLHLQESATCIWQCVCAGVSSPEPQDLEMQYHAIRDLTPQQRGQLQSPYGLFPFTPLLGCCIEGYLMI